MVGRQNWLEKSRSRQLVLSLPLTDFPSVTNSASVPVGRLVGVDLTHRHLLTKSPSSMLQDLWGEDVETERQSSVRPGARTGVD